LLARDQVKRAIKQNALQVTKAARRKRIVA